MKILPVGHRILIKPDKIEEKTKGGIIIHHDLLQKEQQAQVAGMVVEVGGDCYREYDAPWCKKGDRVLYQRHAGMRVPDGKGGFLEDLLLLNDLDITGIILEENNG